ncbi:AAA family ATPase [Curtobacterium aetherium]|uniref:AAA family ATPase n=1 Tax=Curtobacterium aetherium TaxID=2841594 RepID=A0ACD1E119_9MICO|nr:AAA family ATPase [Curtobacterium sp. L6-1]QWS32550.1 AAA family ATPase [Curtobacterium sp. L6-1]
MAGRLRFVVVERGRFPNSAPGVFTLQRDNWDDFHFGTLFYLHHTDEHGEQHQLGAVKIGHRGQTTEPHFTAVENRFAQLSGEYFSVGQDREYYESLAELPGALGQQVLTALRDVALSPEAFAAAEPEEVFQTSLLRTVSERVILDQFRRIAEGGVALTDYDFTYRYPSLEHQPGEALRFQVTPRSMPPTNVHVLIGSNGAGKTTLLNQMARTVIAGADQEGASGWFTLRRANGDSTRFTNVITVSFSAFDRFAAIRASGNTPYSYVGLKTGDDGETAKTTGQLDDDFASSLVNCARGGRRGRWIAAMSTLYADPLLAETGILELIDGDFVDKDAARETFSDLSSGHKIVVLTMTKLVEVVEEASVALLDEPEAHLHPPLLSAFTRALSDLLEDRNGVAIIATHSPVVLQEVPESCVWAIRRFGTRVRARRLKQETFGEGVGTLTSRVFGLEVTSTGYHQLLQQALDSTSGSYERALAVFGGAVGGEGRAILANLADSAEA